MVVKKRGLGRGLDALLDSLEQTAGKSETDRDGELRHLPVDLVRRGRYQPRSDMRPETLENLANSIRSQGVVQPIVVKPDSQGGYEIIAGERRWRAAQMAGLQDIPAIVRDVPDQAAVAMALIENIQREDLNPLEEARALQRLIDEFGLTHEGVAEAVGRSRAAVSNTLRLLELNDDVKGMLERGDLEMGHARALLALKGLLQSSTARQVAEKGLSVRETERMIRRMAPAKAPRPIKSDPDVQRLQQELSERLGAKVEFQQGARSGRLIIHYGNLDELDGILARIR